MINHNNGYSTKVNDIVYININAYGVNKDYVFRIVDCVPDINEDIDQISIDSWFGQALVDKKIGTTYNYKVNGSKLSLTILEVLNKAKTR